MWAQAFRLISCRGCCVGARSQACVLLLGVLAGQVERTRRSCALRIGARRLELPLCKVNRKSRSCVEFFVGVALLEPPHRDLSIYVKKFFCHIFGLSLIHI